MAQPAVPNAELGPADLLDQPEMIADPAIAEMVAQPELASDSPLVGSAGPEPVPAESLRSEPAVAGDAVLRGPEPERQAPPPAAPPARLTTPPRLEPPGATPVLRPAAPDVPTPGVRQAPAEAVPPRAAAPAPPGRPLFPAATDPAESLVVGGPVPSEPSEASPAARGSEPPPEAMAPRAPAPAVPELEAPIAFGPTLEPFRLPPRAAAPPPAAPAAPPLRSELPPALPPAAAVVPPRLPAPVGPAAGPLPAEPLGLPNEEPSRAAVVSPSEAGVTEPLPVGPPAAVPVADALPRPAAAEVAGHVEVPGPAPVDAAQPQDPATALPVPQPPPLAEPDLAAIVDTRAAPTPGSAPPRIAEPRIAEPLPAASSPRSPEPAAAPRWQPVEERRARPPGHRPAPVDATRATEAAAPPDAASAESAATDTPPEEVPATPVEWLARLQRAFANKPAEGSAPRRPAPRGEPISIGSREILEPLVGAETGAVRVHRGPGPARLLSALRADAVTVGDQIVLGEGRQEDDPKTVGLLAHELTHVARQRAPRFVPPVVAGSRPLTGGARPMARAPVTTGPRSMAAQDRPALRGGATSRAAQPLRPQPRGREADPEESMAVEVEAAAIAAAREQRRAPRRAGEAARSAEAEAAPGKATQPEGEEQPARRWGSLPAPWEPLPDFLESSIGSAEPAEPTAAEGLSAESAFPATVGVPAVRRAPSDRHVPDQHAQGAEAGAAPGGAKPDLDLLARQVYTILKRRLDGERRRAM